MYGQVCYTDFMDLMQKANHDSKKRFEKERVMTMQHVLSSKAWGKRLGTWVLALVMVLFTMAVSLPAAQAVTQKDIDNLKSQAASLNSQKADLQSKLDQLSNSKNAALDQKFLLEEKINVLKEQIALSEQSIKEYGAMIVQKEEELAKAKEEEAKYYDEFCQRVRSMEERGNISYWSVLFNANSFSDLLDQVNAISEVVDYDNQVMDQLAKARQAVADAKAGLEESKAAEEAAKADLESQKADLDQEQAKVEATIQEINSNASAYQDKMHQLEDDSASVASQITQAEQAYKAQIEAQRKAEEARKKAEAEAKRQQQLQQQQQQPQAPSGGSSSSGSSGSTGGSSGDSGSSSGGGSVGSGGYLWPLSGYTRVSSPFGYRNCPYHGQELHGGCDVPAPSGTPIRAAKSGVVVVSTYGSSYGNYVVIAHGDGSRTMYAHQSQRAVSAGETVSQGQTIGYVGSTGNSTGPHLHFELWLNSSSSSRVNPVQYCF